MHHRLTPAMLAAVYLLVSFLFVAFLTGCQDGAENGDDSDEEEKETIASVTEDSDRLDGLFSLFVDQETGDIHMQISKDQLDQDFVYVATVRDAPTITGQFRGNVGEWTKNSIIRLRRHFDRIEFVEQNVAFHFDPEHPLSRAADANISPAMIAVAEIVAEDKDSGTILIDAGPVFLGESFMQLKPSPNPEAGTEPRFDLGSLSADKTRFSNWHTYPQNIDLMVEYVFENPAPVVRGGADVTDSRFVSLKLQHSFIEVPDNDFEPRSYDPRVGYYLVRVTDQVSSSAAPWLDYINRWHLKKKTPGAAISDPVEPIVFWVENTTPLEYRDTIVEATEAWNIAFEQAGFSNAIEARIQPDDVEWDAGDIRYNVIRWTSSPQPVFGGYGPVFVNPRTSQILGSDIMLEQIFMTNRIRQTRIFDASRSTGVESDWATGSAHQPGRCAMPEKLQGGLQLGRAALRAQGAPAEADSELVRQGLFALVLHEVGHTLGLNHNFIASQLMSPEELYGKEPTTSLGYASGSIMDYAPVNVAPRGREQGLYYEVAPGPYDRWAIEFGYSEPLDDPAAEKQRMEALLARSTEPGLRFANDADDMRSPGAGIDPRVMIDDMSSDNITYATDRINLVREVMAGLLESYTEEGATYQELVAAYTLLFSQYNSQAQVISRHVGGVLVDRAVQGQPGATEPFRPVPLAQQRRAMSSLSALVFAPEAFSGPERLYQHLQTQRRDFDFYGTTEDPKVHDRALTLQKGVLDHLLHPVVLKRLSDTALYGNEYTVARSMTDLNQAIFGADKGTAVNTFRQNLQAEYVKRLASMTAPENAGGYDQPSRAMALFTLQNLQRDLAAKNVTDIATRAHTAALINVIEQALDKS